MKMTAYQVRMAFPGTAIIITPDTEYACPTVHWLKDTFYPWFQQQRFNLGLNKWDRRNDCDNFARAFAQAAADCHALSNGDDSEGLAVGEFYYHQATGGHAINVAFTDIGKVFIEPQTGQIITLKPEEERTCFFVRI